MNSLTRRPIGRAMVYSQDNRYATLTDSDGHFEFKIPSPQAQQQGENSNAPNGLVRIGSKEIVSTVGFYNPPPVLMARKPGFLSDENNPPTPISDDQKEVTLYLTPAARIVGHVTAEVADLPERVQVEIYSRQIQDGQASWIRAGQFRTWANGEFRFPELSPGTYKIFTQELMDRDPLTFNPGGQLYGYPPVFFPNSSDFASASAIQLLPGVTFDATLSPVRREYYRVEVSVTNAPEGAPISVEVSAGTEGGPGYSLGYNPQAQKIEGFLPDGMYTLELSSYGQTSATGSTIINLKGGPVNGETVTMSPTISIPVNFSEDYTSAQAAGGDLQLSTFADSARRRRRNIQVYLEAADEFRQGRGASLRQPTGPEDDSMVLENVWPGRYWVHVNPPQGYVASLKSGETDLVRHPLVVSPGGSVDPIDVTLRDDGAEVDGIIEDIPQTPPRSSIGLIGFNGSNVRFFNSSETPPHVYLIPLPDSSGEFREIWASTDGKFSLQQIPPGDYRVLAFDRPQRNLEYRNEESLRNYHAQEQDIRLVAGQKQELRLRMITESNQQ